MYYETIFIVNPDVSQENTESITDNFVERVEKAGGRIVKREYWGSRPLAYSITKRKRGHYVMLVTDGEPKAVETLEQAIRLDERIMRFLTTRLTELSDEPSPLVRRRSTAAAQEEKGDDETPATEEAKAEATEAAAEAPAAEEAKVEATEAAAEAPAAKKTKAESAKTSGEEAGS
ncbi:MAG: 30S ribosomal protein S6 [Mariprofundaceae bacterium]|nr:30S ribosomal protein S6 [Mariprofundaceae bacterium]